MESPFLTFLTNCEHEINTLSNIKTEIKMTQQLFFNNFYVRKKKVDLDCNNPFPFKWIESFTGP